MKKDSFIRIIGIIMVLAPIPIFIYGDFGGFVSFLLGISLGLGLSLFLFGEKTKIFNKFMFTSNDKE